MPPELTANEKKIVIMKCHRLLLYTTMNHFLIEYDIQWKVDCTWQLWWPAQGLDQKKAPKHLPKPNLHQKRSWSLFGGLLPIWSTTAFSILANPLHLRSMLSKLMRCTENFNTCAWSLQWSTERAPFFSMTMPDHISQPMLQKLNKLDHQVLLHLPDSPDLSPSDYHFFKHLDNFLQGKCFHNQQDAENSFQEFIEFQSTYFYAIGINKLISHWQKCLYCNGFYFD